MKRAVTPIAAVVLLFALILIIALVGFTSLSTTGGSTGAASSPNPLMVVGLIVVGIVGYFALRRRGR